MAKIPEDKLVEALENLGAEVSRNVDRLNCGGCGVYAWLVAKALDALGIKTEVVATNMGWGDLVDLNEVREQIAANMLNLGSKRHWEQLGAQFAHVGVRIKVGKKYYVADANSVNPGKTRLCNWKVYKGAYTLEEAEAFAKEARGWNDWFDRGQIPTIRKIVNKHLSPKNFAVDPKAKVA
jgi:hypothetical protein